MMAAMRGDIDTAKYLINQAGADINLLTPSGCSIYSIIGIVRPEIDVLDMKYLLRVRPS